MLTELVEFGHKVDEKMKVMLSEIKEIVQGTNSVGTETGTQIMVAAEGRNTHSTRKE